MLFTGAKVLKKAEGRGVKDEVFRLENVIYSKMLIRNTPNSLF